MKGETLWRQKNFRKQSRTVPKKKFERGDSLVPSGFVGYLEKVKNERGTLCTKFALAPLPDWAPWVVSGLFLKSGPISVNDGKAPTKNRKNSMVSSVASSLQADLSDHFLLLQ